ncbi:MAG: glycosyltransferase family 2 protein, partial [Gemmatimonadaceae bacterium]
FITGCALVVSRAAYDILGPLPECYFPAYMEDAEYSWRARAAGLAVLYAPRPLVYHRGGASAGRATESPWPAYLGVRHRLFFVRRNLRGRQRAIAIGYMIVTKPARALIELVRGRPAMAGAILRGLVSGLWSPAARSRPSARG